MPQWAGHSVQVDGYQSASPGMTPSSGGTSPEINSLLPVSLPQAESTPALEKSPTSCRKILRFIKPYLYLWQVAQSVGAPVPRWQVTHQPILWGRTLRTSSISLMTPWQQGAVDPGFDMAFM